jgi:perosamine synthetase
MASYNNDITIKLVDAISTVVRPSGTAFVPLHEPTFRGREKDYVTECIETGWVSTAGQFVERFELELAAYCGVRRAVAVCNGTAALHTCLVIAGVQPGDEVIIPALTFVATANAVRYAGAIPHFADSEETTLGIDPAKLTEHLEMITVMRDGACYNRETGNRIAAISPMHTFGHPSMLDELLMVANRFNIALVEDAAEALGSDYKGRHCGGFGKINAVSFNGNKVITTGGGGALLTNDDALADRAKHITTTAKLPHRWYYDHDVVGYNYRMPNLNAALGVAQLEQLPGLLEGKRALAMRYAQIFADIPNVNFITEPEHCKSNYWLNALLLDRGSEKELEPILKVTNDAGLMTRPAWRPMHQLPMFTDAPRMNLSVAESLAQRLINIPSSAGLL